MNDRGFTVDKFRAAGALHELEAIYDSLNIDPIHGFYASCNQADPPVAAYTHHAILTVLQDHVPDLLAGRKPFLAGFVSKGIDGGPLSFHQDLTYTDERRHRTEMAWIPLVDVDEDHGALRVVPESHRWTTGARPASCRLPTDVHQSEFERRAVTCSVPAGSIVRYDAAAVHGSHPNRGRVRAAVAVASVSAGVDLVHCLAGLEYDIEAYAVDSSYYLSQSLWSRPEGHAKVAPWARAVTAEDFTSWFEGPSSPTTVPAP